MQLTISLPDILPDQIARVMNKVKELFAQEGIPVEIKPDAPKGDSWDNLRIEDIAVDTGKPTSLKITITISTGHRNDEQSCLC